MRFLILFIFLFYSCISTGQVSISTTENTVNELIEFITLPNFGLNQDDIADNITWLSAAFKKRGFTTTILETKGNPLFLADMRQDASFPTVLFYMHLDGQAVDPGKWDQPNPYQAVIKRQTEDGSWQVVEESELENLDEDWRIFGRSASDDKGPIIAFLNAMDILRTKSVTPKYNIKIILDGEEELGSKPLADAVKKYRHLLQADALVINDGPVHLSGQPTLNFGCRGIMTMNLTVYGPVKPQHSGHYGNYAPNPVFRLSHLLASMKSDDGRVLVKGYYDDIDLDEKTKRQLASVPDNISEIHELLQINTAETVGANYQEALQYPSLNARGINAGWVGAKARTIVPDNATVAIDMRLVPESNPDSLVSAVRQHIADQGYHIVDREPTKEERMTYPKLVFMYSSSPTLPFRTDMDTYTGQWLEQVVKKTFDTDPIKIRIMGGTVPIAAFINELNIPAVIVPMVNPDNNQHSPNENLRIGHLKNAVKLFEGILNSEPKF